MEQNPFVEATEVVSTDKQTDSGMSRRRSPHIASRYTVALVDYNGTGIWSVEGIQTRYRKYARDLGTSAHPLTPQQHTRADRTWIYPLMRQVIEQIEAGDRAAIEIGIDFIMEDDFFAFGKVLKSNTARALRRAILTEEQKARIRKRLVAMLLAGQVPHEWHEYRKLLKKVGLGTLWPVLDAGVDRTNQYVMVHYVYLHRYART